MIPSFARIFGFFRRALVRRSFFYSSIHSILCFSFSKSGSVIRYLRDIICVVMSRVITRVCNLIYDVLFKPFILSIIDWFHPQVPFHVFSSPGSRPSFTAVCKWAFRFPPLPRFSSTIFFPAWRRTTRSWWRCCRSEIAFTWSKTRCSSTSRTWSNNASDRPNWIIGGAFQDESDRVIHVSRWWLYVMWGTLAR